MEQPSKGPAPVWSRTRARVDRVDVGTNHRADLVNPKQQLRGPVQRTRLYMKYPIDLDSF